MLCICISQLTFLEFILYLSLFCWGLIIFTLWETLVGRFISCFFCSIFAYVLQENCSWFVMFLFQYTDEEVECSYEEFYEDVHTELLKYGEIVNFKVANCTRIFLLACSLYNMFLTHFMINLLVFYHWGTCVLLF